MRTTGPKRSKEQKSFFSKPDENSTDFKFAIVGRAARLGFDPELPKHTTEWTSAVNKTPLDSEVRHAKKNVNGCTLYMVAWHIMYQATGVPNEMADLGELHDTLFMTDDVPGGELGDS